MPRSRRVMAPIRRRSSASTARPASARTSRKRSNAPAPSRARSWRPAGVPSSTRSTAGASGRPARCTGSTPPTRCCWPGWPGTPRTAPCSMGTPRRGWRRCGPSGSPSTGRPTSASTRIARSRPSSRPSSRRCGTARLRPGASSMPRCGATIPWAHGWPASCWVGTSTAPRWQARWGRSAMAIPWSWRTGARPRRCPSSWPRSVADAASSSMPGSATSVCARWSACSRRPATGAPSAATPGSGSVAARRPISWVRPLPSTSVAPRSWRCRPRGWA